MTPKAQRKMYNHDVYLIVLRARLQRMNGYDLTVGDMEEASRYATHIADSKYPPPKPPTNPDDLAPLL